MPLLTTSPQPLRRKERFTYPNRLPPAFWDKLSEVPLTKNAIRELERRNTEESLHTQFLGTPPPRRPIMQRSVTQYLNRIRRFARRGGPNLSGLRGYRCRPSIASRAAMNNNLQSHLGRRKRGSADALESAPTPPRASTKKTSPYDRAFQQILIDYGIYPNKYRYPNEQTPPPPENLEEIIQVMAQPRLSLSPLFLTQRDFEDFTQKDADAYNEAQVMTSILPIIEGDVRNGRSVAGQILLTNLEDPTVDLLIPGNPDRYYGARPEQLDRRVRIQLGKHIMPSTQHDLPIVPNFFLNVKGPKGSPEVAENQACYDGVLGARGLNSLQAYSDSDLDSSSKAYTLTSTYQKGLLKIYASYPLPRADPGMRREYAMMQVNAYALTGNIDNFRIGVSAYRNARDWAKQKRDEAIQRANETVVRDERDILSSSSHYNLHNTTVKSTDCGIYMLGFVREFLQTPRKFAEAIENGQRLDWDINESVLRKDIRANLAAACEAAVTRVSSGLPK
ncbi:hypothetical protein F4808DRAFT_474360 [Astrocystis sublimbata]|nr:hypothetical protein F4808DRAFT_474360 [Astrocystis sublimbata]